jgi:predicted ArsR family transcriptional regulator
MANAQNGRKNVKGSKPIRKQHTEAIKKNNELEEKIRGESKQAALIKLLKRPNGASIDEMAEAIGWQHHSVRGMMSGVLKKRLKLSITSEKEERGRIYRIAT